jgi:hypothetical protein
MKRNPHRLRIKTYTLGELTIQVNTNYRDGVGYRAVIRGQAGKFGDSTESPEEAIGQLFIEWVFEKENEKYS